MKNAIIIFLAILLMVGTASATTIIEDDAEDGLITDYWSVLRATYSDEQAHNGSYSIKLGCTNTLGANANFTMLPTNFDYMSVWMYDSMNKTFYVQTNWSNYAGYVATNATQYGGRVGTQGVFYMDVERTLGWHHFEIINEAGLYNIYVDGIGTGMYYNDGTFSNIAFTPDITILNFRCADGDYVKYFDDFHIEFSEEEGGNNNQIELTCPEGATTCAIMSETAIGTGILFNYMIRIGSILLIAIIVIGGIVTMGSITGKALMGKFGGKN